MTDPNTPAKLRKSSTDRMIDGICGGVAEFLRIDPTLVRATWVLLGLAGGVGFVLYLVAMLIMPSPDPSRLPENAVKSSRPGGYLIAGVLLVVAGSLWCLYMTEIFSLHSLAWFSWKAVLPVVLIVIGITLLLKRSKPADLDSHSKEEYRGEPVTNMTGTRRFYRSRREKKLFGVCGGLGEYFGVDPVIVRILFLALFLISFGFAVVAYLLLSILFPEEPISFAV